MPLAAKRVLICGIDGITILALQRALVRAGNYVVIGAETDGDRAIALARQLRPDLALIDMDLYGPISGVETVVQILEEQSLPIIILTADGDAEHVAVAQAAGACGCLVKPFTGDQLLPAIDEAVARFDRVSTLVDPDRRSP